MIMLIDIGNTNIVCAIHDGKTYLHSKRFISDTSNIKNILEFQKYPIQAIAICSVVPRLTKLCIKKLNDSFKIHPFIVSYNNTKVKLKVDVPSDVGADRICNTRAIIDRTNDTCIVIDFGTATTYDVINNNQEGIGGAIAPGIDVSGKYLIENASLLKNTVFNFPATVIGTCTTTNLQSGIMYGGLFSVSGMIKHIEQELNEPCEIFLTGGLSALISSKLNIEHKILPNLTLDGLRLIYFEKH